MDNVSETRRLSSLNLGELLNLIESGTRNLVRELEKKKKKLISSKYGVIFNNMCLNEKLLPNYTYIYM